MFLNILRNVIYVSIFLLIVDVSGLSLIKQLAEEIFITNKSIGSRNSYGYYQKKISFLDDDGKVAYGLFESNHSILDHLEMAVFDFNRKFPAVINMTFSSGLGKMVFGFRRSNMVFTLYTRENLNGTTLKTVHDLPANFTKSKRNIFVTHGWMNSGASPVCQMIKKQLLEHTDSNIFIVDWGPVAKIVTYPIPAAGVRVMALFYSDFINDLIEKIGVHIHNIHLIGHSLGAHLSAFTARLINRGKLSRITGLDPALPSFTIVPDDHLNIYDAEFVDIIHTCGGFLGIKSPIGHVDFYPNGGGPPQPGCSQDWQMMDSCSHGKSYELFAESISNKSLYKAIQLNGPNEECNSIPMGYYVPPNTRGIYSLITN
uniref:Lipase member I-like isoform X1 n=2 Tax=Diabrotica virgifera virgifera TaxID=50390 RepID=A0A6P7GNI4_DIAVI